MGRMLARCGDTRFAAVIRDIPTDYVPSDESVLSVVSTHHVVRCYHAHKRRIYYYRERDLFDGSGL